MAAVSGVARDFTYKKPKNWVKNFPGCKGKFQSPITLRYRTAARMERMPLIFSNYDVPLRLPLKAVNNGKTVRVDIGTTIDGKNPTIRGGWLGPRDVYVARTILFHWGKSSAAGSEHKVGGRKYDMEMHIVHRNSKYRTDEQAQEDPHGFVILAVLLDETLNFTNRVESVGLDQIYKALPYITRANTERKFTKGFPLRSMLVNINTNRFFTYLGSMTMPPCSQAVTWFVFPDIQPIRSDYLRRFWELRDSKKKALLKNFRPLENGKHCRVFYHSEIV